MVRYKLKCPKCGNEYFDNTYKDSHGNLTQEKINEYIIDAKIPNHCNKYEVEGNKAWLINSLGNRYLVNLNEQAIFCQCGFYHLDYRVFLCNK